MSRSSFFSSRTVLLIVTAPFLGILFVFICDRTVERSAAGQHTAVISEISPTAVALVLGCAETLAEGRPNRYFTERIAAAAALFHSGRCRYLLVSGDNGRKNYDEPTRMEAALITLGVPASAITRDHAGFDTLDSIVRARHVFGQDRLIIVSQRFHNERALYIARHHGIIAQGWDAEDVSFRSGLRTRLREKLARVKTVLDIHLLRSRPKFLGEPITIGRTA